MQFPLSNPHWRKLIGEHREWLSQFDPQHLANWDILFTKNNDEAAMCEARVRRLLQLQGVTVTPNENLNESGKQPDFRCSKDGHVFYVEVTCISIQKVIEETNLPLIPEQRARNYSSLNNSVWSACKGKAIQCSGMNHPTILAIGTFHIWASSICMNKDHVEELLTGEGRIAWQMDENTGGNAGEVYQSTSLYSAVFLRPEKTTEIGFARSSISGLLLCGLGVEPPNVFSILHPNPSRPFKKDLLSDIEFCEVAINSQDRSLSVSWELD
ncbi:hypothetical protein F1728_15140 [Gimesia benthica]|uniref:Uncharacterized protein n=1 Tax=Gimesia benthica TaxID=2608982 RepID=A0A6I6ABP7_9PLAN|nr:hypothetical protein [Gimesia benthica]QGQ23934.1 hypothetical protein F1728_15140 [Gimesia benthica]